MKKTVATKPPAKKSPVRKPVAKRAAKAETKPALPWNNTIRVRSFEGAKANRLTEDWLTSQTSLDSDLRFQLRRLIDRARWMEQNTEYGEAYLKLLERNVCGPKPFPLQMKIYELDGVTHDTFAERLIERHWKRWGHKKYCDAAESMALSDHYRVAVRSIGRDGGHLIQIMRGGDYATRLHAKDIDFLDTDLNTQLKDGSRIVMGVELNQVGAPVAYHLFGEHPGDIYWTGRGDKRTRIPASEIIHPFIRKRANQIRGYPEFAAIMPNIKQLHGYKQAAIVNARAAAAKMGFLEKTPGEQGYSGSDDKTGGQYMEFEDGVIEELPSGLKFTPWDPKQPTTGYGDFVKENIRGDASALGISYISLANDPGDANFSSARVGLVDERESYKMLQQTMIDHVCEPIFAEWLFRGLASGALAPLPVGKIEKFNNPVFRGRRWAWLDPRADSDAARTDLELGITSHAEVAAERGNDEEDVVEEIEQTLTRRAMAGLVPKETLEAIRFAEAMNTAAEEDEVQPLITTIGVGGVQALTQLLASMAQGQVSAGQVEAILQSVFGLSKDEAKKVSSPV